MSYSWDEDIKYGQIRPKNINKIYRHKLIDSSPPLIKKLVQAADSDKDALSFIIRDGSIRDRAHCPVSLLQKDVFGLHNFAVPYSANKKGRWQLLENIANEIGEIQKPEFQMRVTFIRRVWNGLAPDTLRRFRPTSPALDDSIKVKELHSVSDIGSEIHKYCKESTYKTLTSKPKPPKKRRRRQVNHLEEAANEMDGEETANDVNLPPWERRLHVVYCEDVEELSPNIVNMNESLIRGRRGSRYPKMKRVHAKKMLESCPCSSDFEDCTNSNILDTSCISPFRTCQQIFTRDVSLLDCVVQRPPSRIRRKRRSPLTSEASTSGCGSNAFMEERDEEEGKEEAVPGDSDINLTNLPSLHSQCVTLQYSNRLSEKTRIQDILLRCEPIKGLFPPTVCAEVDNSQFYDSKLPLPPGFKGHLLLQQLTEYGKNVKVRCILNPGISVRRRPEFPVRTSILFPEKCKKKFEVANFSAEVEHFSEEGSSGPSEIHCLKASSSGNHYPVMKKCNNCCEDSSNCVALSCCHFFCESCWIAHIKTCLYTGNFPVRCMEYGCDVVMGKSQMMVLVPFDVCCRCEKLTIRCASLKRLRGFKWFKCETCGIINKIVSANSKNKFASCHCGSLLCLFCLKEAHFPLKCSHAEAYRNISDAANIDGYESSFSVNVRKCPHCNAFCEKSYGCNHIVCICGNEFCYNCCQNYISSEHHNNCEKMEYDIELIDVPKLFKFVPQCVYDKCMALRHQRNVNSITHLHSFLSKHGTPVELKGRIIFAVYWGYMALELSCIFDYFARRHLRKRNKSEFLERNALGLKLKLGFMWKCYGQLQFRLWRLRHKYQKEIINLPELETAVELVEQTLTEAITYSEWFTQ